MKKLREHLCVVILLIASGVFVGDARANNRQDRHQDNNRQRQDSQQCKKRPKVIHTARPPAKVTCDVESWGTQTVTNPIVVDPTKATVLGLPRGARANLKVQERSNPLDLSFPKGKIQKGAKKQSKLGMLKQRLRAAANTRIVWETQDASPDITSGEIAKTWVASDKVLPVNQPYKLQWSHEAKADGLEKKIIQGTVQGLKEEITRTGREVKTKAGRLAHKYEGFIQRKNLFKTDAYKTGKGTFVMVRGVRALPNKYSYTIRNLQTGETVSGTADRDGSFKKRIPVVATAEQQLELTIHAKDKNGIETTLTSSLGRVTFSSERQVNKKIAYHFVERFGRKMDTFSANVEGTTVYMSKRRSLRRPELQLSSVVNPGPPDKRSTYSFTKAKAQAVLSLANISAGTSVEIIQQHVPQDGGKPQWEVLDKQTVHTAPANGRHVLRFDKLILAHTPLKIRVKRPADRNASVIYTSMPSPGDKPTGDFGGVERVYKHAYGNWLRPETVRRTVAYVNDAGVAVAKVFGKLIAPASARVSIVNGSTGKETRPKRMKNSFLTTVEAKPGHELSLKVQYADGKVETTKLGIVPDAVDSSYQPTGLRFFPFTKNYVTKNDDK